MRNIVKEDDLDVSRLYKVEDTICLLTSVSDALPEEVGDAEGAVTLLVESTIEGFSEEERSEIEAGIEAKTSDSVAGKIAGAAKSLLRALNIFSPIATKLKKDCADLIKYAATKSDKKKKDVITVKGTLAALITEAGGIDKFLSALPTLTASLTGKTGLLSLLDSAPTDIGAIKSTNSDEAVTSYLKSIISRFGLKKTWSGKLPLFRQPADFYSRPASPLGNWGQLLLFSDDIKYSRWYRYQKKRDDKDTRPKSIEVKIVDKAKIIKALNDLSKFAEVSLSEHTRAVRMVNAVSEENYFSDLLAKHNIVPGSSRHDAAVAIWLGAKSSATVFAYNMVEFNKNGRAVAGLLEDMLDAYENK